MPAQQKVEVVNFCVSAFGMIDRPSIPELEKSGAPPMPASRPVYFDGKFRDTPVFARASLPAGFKLRRTGDRRGIRLDHSRVSRPGTDRRSAWHSDYPRHRQGRRGPEIMTGAGAAARIVELVATRAPATGLSAALAVRAHPRPAGFQCHRYDQHHDDFARPDRHRQSRLHFARAGGADGPDESTAGRARSVQQGRRRL